jgi:hypothetical protein
MVWLGWSELVYMRQHEGGSKVEGTVGGDFAEQGLVLRQITHSLY